MTTDSIATITGPASEPVTRSVSEPGSGATGPGARQSGASWLGVVALMIGVFALVTSEFLPASLLSPIASGLGISEGTAGQAVTATALVGIFAGPAIGPLFPRLDRRMLLVGLAVLATVSNVLVALAPAFWLLVVARLLLGVAIAGFWSMALAVAAQLVPPARLGRAMMVVNTGVSVATVAAVPLGAYLGSLWDWRTVFLLTAGLTLIAAVAQVVSLPRIAPAEVSGPRTLLDTLSSPVMIMGLVGIVLLVGGHFNSFTYIRLGAGEIPGLNAGGLALLLAVFGVGGFFGNIAAGIVADRWLRLALVGLPLLLGAAVITFALLPSVVPIAFAAAVVWGFAFGGIPTTMQTWAARVEPDRMEAAGGLVVSGFQLAITLGAAIGGLLVDGAGVTDTFIIGGIAAVLGGVVLGFSRQRG
ncbi:MFS transporter [Rathayibacter soli]|uniref:MFS transporter n=1 Tax=Rathayibacter soli TaxID=3144168 RepID=UPI0027E3BA35|nr:MFS transporter [Glaciibacter superstes]